MIGIFDSGSGGLTVFKAVRDRIPSADVVYFGDTQNMPYGEKSRAELSHFTVAGIKKLRAYGATNIISACNSVSASIAISLFDTLDIAPTNLIEMVGPTASYFRHADSRILLCATRATIDSGVYQDAFSMLGKEIQTLALPELASAIEEGKSEEEIERIIRDAFSSVGAAFTVVILACTHYPLVAETFRKVLGDNILIFDPAEAVAERVEHLWWPCEAGNGSTRFLISSDSAPFRARVAKLFPESASNIGVVE